MEVPEEFLQPQEVPGRLGRIGGEIGIRQRPERSVHERGKDDEESCDDEKREEFLRHQVREHVDAVTLLSLHPLNSLRRNEREESMFVGRSRLCRGDPPGGWRGNYRR
jgi:hypothetical protein